VVDHLGRTFHGKDVGMALIYCSYKEQTDQSLTNLIASLLQQLIQRHPVVPNKVRSLYDQHISKRTRPTFAECRELLRSELTGCSRAFIIVDALDECDETNGTRSGLIAELLGLPPIANLLVTSRHVLSIEDKLNQSPRLEIRASDMDVRIYLEDRIQKESRLKRHVQADPSLRNSIIDTIVKKVQGMSVSHLEYPASRIFALGPDYTLGFF
jgi:ankyrin repeat domain-containing protein 50